MISTSEQFCKIILHCMDRYSKDTTGIVANILNSHERVFTIEEMLKSNPTEQEFLKMLNKEFPTTK